MCVESWITEICFGAEVALKVSTLDIVLRAALTLTTSLVVRVVIIVTIVILSTIRLLSLTATNHVLHLALIFTHTASQIGYARIYRWDLSRSSLAWTHHILSGLMHVAHGEHLIAARATICHSAISLLLVKTGMLLLGHHSLPWLTTLTHHVELLLILLIHVGSLWALPTLVTCVLLIRRSWHVHLAACVLLIVLLVIVLIVASYVVIVTLVVAHIFVNSN